MSLFVTWVHLFNPLYHSSFIDLYASFLHFIYFKMDEVYIYGLWVTSVVLGNGVLYSTCSVVELQY